MADHRDDVLKLKEEGLGDTEIARRVGISRQRVAQILKPKSERSKPTLDSKVMLNISDVSQLLGVHVNTVRRWTNKGILRAYRICSRGDRRYRREDIDSFLRECR